MSFREPWIYSLLTFTLQHGRQHCPDFFVFKSRRNLIFFRRTTFHIPQDMVFSWNTVWEPWVRVSVRSFFPWKTLSVCSHFIKFSFSGTILELPTSLHFPTVAAIIQKPLLIHSFSHSLSLPPSLLPPLVLPPNCSPRFPSWSNYNPFSTKQSGVLRKLDWVLDGLKCCSKVPLLLA